MSDVVMEEKTSCRKRKKKLQKRKPSSGEEGDEEDGNGGFPAWKTVVVIAVIVACLAILYPKMFHPMLLFVLGLNKKEPETDHKFSHPSHRGSGPPGHASFSPDPHIHAGGPHPGMRMPPQMGTQQGGKSGGKGTWHWMLPFYTVGVIIFLLYTLSKILWKSPKKKNGMRYKTRKDKYELDSEANSSNDSYESEEEETEKGKLSNKELCGLQKRLNQTESAMQLILEQLETISGSVDQSTAESVKRMTMDTLNNLARAEASDLVAEVENSSQSLRSHKQRRDEDGDVGGGQYLQDLEKALTDFKRFTDNYVQLHSANAASGYTECKGTKVQEQEGDKQQEAEDRENSEYEEEEGGGQLQQGSDQEDSEDEEEEEECESFDPHPQESKEQKQDLEDGDEESTGDDDDDEGSENDVASAANDVDQLKKWGFDPMEGENSDLRIPDVHGEIIPVDEGGFVKKDKDSVRKRSKKM